MSEQEKTGLHQFKVPYGVLLEFLQIAKNYGVTTELIRTEGFNNLVVDVIYQKHQRMAIVDIVELIDEYHYAREDEKEK
jgi:hypothetical protein